MTCKDCSELRETNPYSRCERCADYESNYYDEVEQ